MGKHFLQITNALMNFLSSFLKFDKDFYSAGRRIFYFFLSTFPIRFRKIPKSVLARESVHLPIFELIFGKYPNFASLKSQNRVLPCEGDSGLSRVQRLTRTKLECFSQNPPLPCETELHQNYKILKCS